jgi:NADPH-dependent ferric siderophore reductase
MKRVSLVGEDLRGFTAPCADSYIKLFFPRPGQDRPQLPAAPDGDISCWYRSYLAMPDDIRPAMRTYTVRRHSGVELDVDFVLHDDGGPASRWASTARPGDNVAFFGPGGVHSVPEQTDWQLLIGDETALPAIGAILESLPRGAVAHAYIEVDNPAEQQDFQTLGNIEVQWIHRHAGPHGKALLDAVRSAEFPAGRLYGWISGEASLVKFARRHLVRDRGFDRRAIAFTGYWRLGLTQDEENQRQLEG